MPRPRAKHPAIDLEAILGAYTGNAALDRLLHIAERAEDREIALDALRHAQRALESSVNPFTLKPPAFSNGRAYERAMAIAKKREFSSSEIELSREWLEKNARSADAELRKLESGLSDLLTERVKENLRMQYVELGDHYYDRGDLKNALACYMRTRDYCSTPKHVISMCLSIVAVSLESESFAHVNVHANKATTSLDRLDDDDHHSGETRLRVRNSRTATGSLRGSGEQVYRDFDRNRNFVSERMLGKGCGDLRHTVHSRALTARICEN